ncbi:hypothetical protein L195_g031412, partial [Trifolium pratense]
AERFGFEKPTKVIFDYQIANNEFKMTVIGTVENQNMPTTFETIINPFEDGVEEAKVVEELEDVGQNEPAEEPQDVGQDEPAEEPLHVGQQPIEWNKTVFRSMANLSKKQVLDIGAFEKHIAEGWYDYMLSHRPRAGDNLRFMLFPNTFKLNVNLQRRNRRRN